VSEVTIGVVFATFAALGLALTIAVARLAAKTPLTPADLVALRFGVGALIFLPILLRTRHSLPVAAKRAAVPLSFLHGWGMAGLSFLGVAYAPASHAAALGPGCIPVFVALLTLFFLRRRIEIREALGLLGICLGAGALFAATLTASATPDVWFGDSLFITAGLLAACYLVFVEKHRVPALAGNALVTVVSAIVALPIYLLLFESGIPATPAADVAQQALFQGVLLSAAYLAVHQAVLRIGGARTSIIMASIPALTLIAGWAIAGDPVSLMEAFAIGSISLGVLVGGLCKLRIRAAT
jgi:drug/metabolite transporter (DMT)-like permease